MKITEAIIRLSTNIDLNSKIIAEFIKVNRSKDLLSKKIIYPTGKEEQFKASLFGLDINPILKKIKNTGTRPVFFFEKHYPELLKKIPDLPAVLYCRGNTKLLKEKYLVALVGSRKATQYGLRQTIKITHELSDQGIVIVSGLAFGIDATAHQATLEAQGKTIAVLGTAINTMYPVNNEPLARKILKSDGLIISEFPPDYPTFKYNFPMRNRIIAGMSQATIVTEAAEKSGALITAGLALEYNRDVYSLPADVDRFSARGTNILLLQGATPLLSPKQILNDLGLSNFQNQVKIDKDQSKVLNTLSEGQSGFDRILKETKLDAPQLNVVLLELEMKALIKQIGGGVYIKC